MSLNSFEDQDTCLSRNFEPACIVDNNCTVFFYLTILHKTKLVKQSCSFLSQLSSRDFCYRTIKACDCSHCFCNAHAAIQIKMFKLLTKVHLLISNFTTC